MCSRLLGVSVTPLRVTRTSLHPRRILKKRIYASSSENPQDPEEDAESRIERLEATSRGRSPPPNPVETTTETPKPTWREGQLLPDDWSELSLFEKAWAIYAGERGALFWANKFALAAAIVVGVSWILFRFVGPTLGLYELKSTFTS